ncbi:eukaryotic translation initiation factor 2 subunit beta, partial [Tanacetum coccineum]
LHRQPDHVMAYLLAELGTRGTLDGRQRLKGTLVEKLVEETARDAQHLRNLISICEGKLLNVSRGLLKDKLVKLL